ncbi:unnamed protein product [Peronospora belbahrii]|uniref:FYVE-type domain-containing protein n=1 Tax=Peronospora belbahrii TaxID=622444 RepID=A0AAU9KXV1_9STRA|nr:unnamed protein product [Peronospora belbahrii]CAH0519341.1 unnamed protein product [Peronospora belbahrii]
MGEASVILPPPMTPSTSPPSLPVMSPPWTSSTSRSGRKLRQKVVDEIKNVRVRKSPVHKEKLVTRTVPPLPPLELNEEVDEDEDDVVQQDRQALVNKAKGCSLCERSFTVFRAKHTCRMCAQKICDDCSKNRMKLHRRLERKKGSRLCDPCAKNYLHTENGSGEDMVEPFPDSSPPLTAIRSEDALIQKQEDTANGSSRRHSVPTKQKTSLLYSQNTAPKSSPKDAPAASKQVATRIERENVRRVVYLSHLRARHWVSLLVFAVLVILRVIYFNRWTGTEENVLVPATAASSLSEPPYSFMEGALDNLLSMRTLGTYLLGLVLFDELLAAKENKAVNKSLKQRRRRRRRVSTSSGRQEQTESPMVNTSVARELCTADSPAPSSPHTSQDDDLEVAVNERNNDDEGFTVDKLVVALEEGAKNRAPGGDLSLGCFMNTCTVICGFLGVFGRATSFAGSTVGAYFTSIDQNTDTWSEPSSSQSWKEQSVKAVIEHEVSLGVADVGGKKKPSCSRCLLRLLWFIQFVEACVRLTLLDSTEDNCFNGASKAYEETLGKRHPWLVRKGVNTALGSIPSRSHILEGLHVGEGEGLEPLRKAHVELVRVIAELKAIFEKHGLTDLK